VPSRASALTGALYRFLDTAASADMELEYRVEAIDSAGNVVSRADARPAASDAAWGRPGAP